MDHKIGKKKTFKHVELGIRRMKKDETDVEIFLECSRIVGSKLI